jgi:RimJ/RimL family protein N-acetyltransferase
MDGLVAQVRKIRRKPRVTAPSVALVSVYRLPKTAPELLYRLLEEREPHVNISHRGMPTWKSHVKFIAGHPYSAWYLIRSGQDYVGAIYLTALGEIGIGVLGQWRGHGFGRAAIRALMRKHPRGRFLANINPSNATSIRMFGDMGFRIIQQTYELRSK